MAELGSPELKNLATNYSERSLYCSLYRAIKLTNPIDVVGIKDGWVSLNMDSGSPRQSVGVLSAADFQPFCG